MSPTVSVVLPVRNQADHILEVVRSYQETLNRAPYTHEIVLVVNASLDRSLEVCRKIEEQNASIRVVSSPEPGWGRAVRLGLERATGDVLCYTNSARTSPQDLLLLSLYAVANPQAAVKAHRRSRESLLRRAGSFLFNLECRGLFDLATWDINATPKAFSREIYEKIRPRRDDDLIDLEFFLECRREKIVVLEVPTYSWQRFGGASTTNFSSALKLYSGAFRMWRERGEVR
jgi:glycosyltransferase involved in cell wall biosynthesis